MLTGYNRYSVLSMLYLYISPKEINSPIVSEPKFTTPIPLPTPYLGPGT